MKRNPEGKLIITDATKCEEVYNEDNFPRRSGRTAELWF